MQNQQRTLTFIFIILFSNLVHAESVKLIQWWDQYLPMRTGITGFYRAIRRLSPHGKKWI